MIFSRDVVCKICDEVIPSLGLCHHISKNHTLSYEDYKKKYIYQYGKCGTCGGITILPRKFCSIRCANKKRDYRRHTVILTEQDEKSIVNFYESGKTREEVCAQFTISVEKANKIFDKYCIVRHNRYETIRRNQDKIALEFSKSDLGKKIISEYQQLGISLKKLEKKYDISKVSLKKLFILNGIKIKTNKESLHEVLQSKKQRGIRNPNFGKSPAIGSGKCHWYFYGGIKYQGSWEFKVGLWLKNDNKVFLCHTGVRQFEYERNGVKYTYCPDFYIPDEDYFIEVKGYFSEKDKEKIKIIRETYPDIRIDIYNKKILEEKGILNVNKKLGLNLSDYMLDYKLGEFFLDRLKKSVTDSELIRQNIIEKKSLSVLAKQYDVPYIVLCRYYYTLVPKPGSKEFISFIFKTFFNPKHKQIIYNAPNANVAAEALNTGLSFKRNLEIASLVRKSFMKVGIAA